jgi:hypothetical protein
MAARDFQAVVTAYRSLEDRLSRVEQARLGHAIRRLGESSRKGVDDPR